ncbi:MAG: ABC transporter ATP-binding protein [Haloferacaceae archaeon]
MSDALVVDGVRKRYGDVTALAGVSLSVAAGEVFGLIGPNGAGKTTLVRALTGTTPVDGRIEVLGAPPGAVDAARIGLLPQSFAPAGRLTARELVTYYAGLYDDARDVDGVLADVGLAGDADVRYEDLSGGQQRRVCVATALVNEPDVLFLDEPTTGIDPAGSRALRDLLADLADGGTTVFLTSHSMAEVERLADRVGLLADGDLVEVGPPARLIAEYGGESRVEVETDAAPDALGAVEADLIPLDGVAVERTAGGLVVRGVGPAEIGRVVEALEDAGVAYDALAWRQPGLEDVYLRLTGERFEGGVGAAAVANTVADGARATGSDGTHTPDADGGERA